MTIELSHTIVPARDKVAAAKFFATILGLPFDDLKINHRDGGRGVYLRDPDGHILELLTVEHAQENVASFNESSENSPLRMMIDSEFSCAGCHRK